MLINQELIVIRTGNTLSADVVEYNLVTLDVGVLATVVDTPATTCNSDEALVATLIGADILLFHLEPDAGTEDRHKQPRTVFH